MRIDTFLFSFVLMALILLKFPVFLEYDSAFINILALLIIAFSSFSIIVFYKITVSVFELDYCLNVVIKWLSLSLLYLLIFLPVNADWATIVNSLFIFSATVIIPLFFIVKQMKKTVSKYPEVVYVYSFQIKQYHYNVFFICTAISYLTYQQVQGDLKDISFYLFCFSLLAMVISLMTRVSFIIDKDIIASIAFVSIVLYPLFHENTEFYFVILVGVSIRLLRDFSKLVLYIVSPKKFFLHNRFPKMINTDIYRNYCRFFKGVNCLNSFVTYNTSTKKISSIFVNDFYFILKEVDELRNKHFYDVFNLRDRNINRERYLKFRYTSKLSVTKLTSKEMQLIIHFKSLQDYLVSNGLSYSQLTDDDFTLIDMIDY